MPLTPKPFQHPRKPLPIFTILHTIALSTNKKGIYVSLYLSALTYTPFLVFLVFSYTLNTILSDVFSVYLSSMNTLLVVEKMSHLQEHHSDLPFVLHLLWGHGMIIVGKRPILGNVLRKGFHILVYQMTLSPLNRPE